MGNLAARGVFKRDADGLSPSADAGIIRATKRGLINVKMESLLSEVRFIQQSQLPYEIININLGEK